MSRAESAKHIKRKRSKSELTCLQGDQVTGLTKKKLTPVLRSFDRDMPIRKTVIIKNSEMLEGPMKLPIKSRK